jgi:hypothetical protein
MLNVEGSQELKVERLKVERLKVGRLFQHATD